MTARSASGGSVREATDAELEDWDARTVDVVGGQVLQSRAWAAHRERTGWLAHHLKRLEHASNRFKARFPEMKMNAADYWRRQVYATFQDDVPGVRTRDLIGVDRLMWGSDYPHFDSTFPNSRKEIEKNFTGVPEDERALILGGTMAKVYNLN